MTLRGKAAIAGFAELPTQREYPGRSMWSLCAEVARMAIEDSGLRKEDIDGLITEGGVVYPSMMADAVGIQPVYAAGMSMMGCSSGTAITTAASIINAGVANNILVVMAATEFRPGAAPPPPGVSTEFERPYGPAAAANTGYGVMYRRHMHEYGTTEEQLAHISVNQRFNALLNPNAVFRGQPITHEDVMKSRYINYPLKLLECVMPCAGAAAVVVTSAERAKALPNPRVNVLGVGVHLFQATYWTNERLLTTTPTRVSGPRALNMAGYNGHEMQLAEFYDWYTILVAGCLEDSGIWGLKKGDIGPFVASHDTTYKGTHPVNTDGGQISGGQPGLAGGFRHFVEAVRQLMGRAGERQVVKHDLAMTNHWGGPPSQMASTVLGTDAAL